MMMMMMISYSLKLFRKKNKKQNNNIFHFDDGRRNNENVLISQWVFQVMRHDLIIRGGGEVKICAKIFMKSCITKLKKIRFLNSRRYY